VANDLINYQFESETVRVIMIAGDPWFVANDLAKALGYSLATNMTKMLEDDEKGIHNVNTLGGDQDHLIVSESGMYAAVLKSRRPQAKRFRRWVTGEVLPSLRRTGSYTLHTHEPPPAVAGDYDPPRLMASVAVVREARRLFGTPAARQVWVQLGLPCSIAHSHGTHEGDPMAEPLQDWLAERSSCTIQEAAEGIGIAHVDQSVRFRIGQLLRLWGWQVRKVRRGNATVNLFSRHAVATSGQGGGDAR
jgi:hypothetical protein